MIGIFLLHPFHVLISINDVIEEFSFGMLWFADLVFFAIGVTFRHCFLSFVLDLTTYNSLSLFLSLLLAILCSGVPMPAQEVGGGTLLIGNSCPHPFFIVGKQMGLIDGNQFSVDAELRITIVKSVMRTCIWFFLVLWTKKFKIKQQNDIGESEFL